MMATIPDKEIKRIYEKSVKLLNDSQAQLSKTRQVLKKAVIRLVIASQSKDEQVNNVLNEIEVAVNNTINLEALDSELDDLFVLINHRDYRRDKSKEKELYSCFANNLANFECSDSSTSVISPVRQVVDKKLSNDETAIEILKIINELSTGNNLELNNKKQENEKIDLFIKNISDNTDFEFSGKNNNAAQLMDDLANELKKYIYAIKRNNTNGKHAAYSDNNSSRINAVLIEIVNQLSLPDSVKKKQKTLLKKLNNPVTSDDGLCDVIEKTVLLINASIDSIQSENVDLHSFISKVNDQLSEIKTFVKLTRQDRKEAVDRSSGLQKSVNLSVCSIQDKVSSATNIHELKNDITIHLEKIRKHVEENKIAEQKKEEISLQSFSHIINELNSTQEESLRLKEQLQESKSQLLRDPLTGLYNRSAYEERVIVEINRCKRNTTPLCLAVWDLDYFKTINDNYGHDVGDRVLQLFAKLIESKIRKVDLFARIGGEEFVLLMPDTQLDMALILNNKLRQLLEDCNFHYDQQHCPITASVGITEYHDGDTVDSFMKRADQALYQSKDSGRNRCMAYKI